MSVHDQIADQIVDSIEQLNVSDGIGQKKKKMAGNNKIVVDRVTPHNIHQVKVLNQAILPLSYSDKFYFEVRESGDLAQLAFFNDVSVGAICCRIDESTDKKSLYIMTFGVLPAYRKCGIGRKLLEHAFYLVDNDKSIKTISLHVQVDNEVAIKFYKKWGFKQEGKVAKFYQLLPSIDMNEEAYLLVKTVRN